MNTDPVLSLQYHYRAILLTIQNLKLDHVMANAACMRVHSCFNADQNCQIYSYVISIHFWFRICFRTNELDQFRYHF